MIQITNIIEVEKEKLKQIKSKILTKRITILISASDFRELFLIQVNKIIAERNINREFEVTEQNSEVINQLYYYSLNSDNFKGNLEKGIILVGKNGVGKTIILKAYFNIIELLTIKRITQMHSKKLAIDINENGLDYYERRPLFIDDIGKESKEMVKYGTRILPFPDLIALRYDNGSITFGTCNYKLETLIDFYGLTTVDRMKEMFNIIILEGMSFRK